MFCKIWKKRSLQKSEKYSEAKELNITEQSIEGLTPLTKTNQKLNIKANKSIACNYSKMCNAFLKQCLLTSTELCF